MMPEAATGRPASFRGSRTSVVEGRDGWLFVSEHDGVDVLAAYTDEDAIPDSTYETWERTLAARREYFAREGIVYLNLIVPDTCLVYPDKLPDDIRLVAEMPFRKLAARLDPATRAQCVYPLDDLVRGRQVRDTFRRADSHWTDWGAFLGYAATMRALAPQVPGLAVLDESALERGEATSFGDLGVVAVPERSERLEVAHVRDDPTRRIVHVSTHVREAYSVVEQDRPDLPTAVVFRDSAMTAASKFFSQSFRRTVYVSTANTVLYDLVERERPDVVIHEFGERRIVKAPEEHSLTDFAYLFGDLLLEDQPAIDNQKRARILLASGDPRQAVAASDAALATTAPNARLMVFRAEAYTRMDEHAAALESLRHATVLDPLDVFVRHLFAQALRQDGQHDAALAESERVLEIDDRHFAYWGEAIRAAIEAGDPGRAAMLADRAVALFPEASEAHYAAACARIVLRDLATAEDHLRRALEITPTHEVSRRELASVLVAGERWHEAETLINDLLSRSPDDASLRGGLDHVRARGRRRS